MFVNIYICIYLGTGGDGLGFQFLKQKYNGVVYEEMRVPRGFF